MVANGRGRHVRHCDSALTEESSVLVNTRMGVIRLGRFVDDDAVVDLEVWGVERGE